MDRNIVKLTKGRSLCLGWEKHEQYRLRSNWLYNCDAEDKLEVYGGQAWHKPPVHSQQRSGVY